MKRFLRVSLIVLLFLAAGSAVLWFGVLTSAESRAAAACLNRLEEVLQPVSAEAAKTLSADFTITGVEGLPKELTEHRVHVDFRYPDCLHLAVEIDGHTYAMARNGDEAWIHVPHQHFGMVGINEVPRFAGFPDSVETVDLPDLNLPVSRFQRQLLPVALLAKKTETGALECRLRPSLAERWNAGDAVLTLVTGEDGYPREIGLRSGEKAVTLEVRSVRLASENRDWSLQAVPEDQIERVALSHLVRFSTSTLEHLGKEIPALPPLDGSRSVVASHRKGRLEQIEGTRVLFLKGTPEEMGEQHGTLLREEVRDLMDRILYGVGVGSSFAKGRWFFGEIEEAQSRIEPFISDRYLREMDAMATAAGLHRQEARLGNFFPELFHCSGFALRGGATKDGRMFHGRVLDYLRGMGLEENSVVMVMQPDEGNAWVNVSYAGFIGSVTAMNEKHLAIGEMGGRGEGNWDGKPMAQLMREVMERANTIDEAIEIMRAGPRTCEYYYVISDAKTMQAVGIKATPDLFEIIWSGESHPQLLDPVPDTVLMSAGDRYTELVRRVKEGFGNFDADSARNLMARPVCMKSNIQSVLFAPDTLDFWVGNADSANVASHTRYTHYNLRELLDSAPPAEITSAE